MRRLLVLGAMLAGLGALAGCSHSCVPPGWYEARSVPPMQQPPDAPPIAHDPSYDIPGGQPAGRPTHEEACLVQPPNAVTNAAPAAASAPAKAAPGDGRQGAEH